MPAHPRSRGENSLGCVDPEVAGGSSPLTRGKLDRSLNEGAPSGLIPAHAGKTPPRKRPLTSTWAHPRSRGENSPTRLRNGRCPGSSPLTRGKPRWSAPTTRSSRLIPAHAGKTERVKRGHFRPPAHPRSRGENYSSSSACRSDEGSSPLTRGKPQRAKMPREIPRLIPAHAGKTQVPVRCKPNMWAHPRSRGENTQPGGGQWFGQGSSPLTRGKPDLQSICDALDRLIPAHAGKTSSRPCTRSACAAHPRSRGENSAVQPIDPKCVGSSPLTRGKRLHVAGLTIPHRLIPAHAGKTRGRIKAPDPRTAHPRSRGENFGSYLCRCFV